MISRTEFEEEEKDSEEEEDLEEEKHNREEEKENSEISIKQEVTYPSSSQDKLGKNDHPQIVKPMKKNLKIPLVKMPDPSIELINKNLNIEIQEIKKRTKNVNLTLVKIDNQIPESYKQEIINKNNSKIELKDRKALTPIILVIEPKIDGKKLIINKEVPEIEVLDKSETNDINNDKSTPITGIVEYDTTKQEELYDDGIGLRKKKEDKNIFGIS